MDNDRVALKSGISRVGGIAGIEGIEFYHGEKIYGDFARSLHLGWELGMCSGGRAMLVFDKGEKTIEEGTLFLIPPHTAHALERVENHSYCALHLSTELVSELLGYEPPIAGEPIVEHSTESRQTWCWLCHQLLVDLPDAAYRSALTGGLHTILDQLDPDDLREPLPERVAQMRAALQDGLPEKITLAELSERVGLSQFHAARMFTAHLGVSPHEYQILLRVERAKELLLEGLAVTEVAALVGFADQSHLHRYFKRYVHVTPGEYRRWTRGESKKIQAEIAERMRQFLRAEGSRDQTDSLPTPAKLLDESF